jgi:L-threonylcarbamoyladenylate synthase
MNVLAPSRENLAFVAQELCNGKLAVLPTETVYGLAADATNETAVKAIFELKGRPADNPLIVHISSLRQLKDFASEIHPLINDLAEAFMPGPLTIVLPKQPHVSNLVTGGLDTVAIRMPDHPVCLGILELGGLALAMPSANPFMGLSPTNALMIDPQIGNGVVAVVDGGACSVGIESTVLDLTGKPTILRPGAISREEIEMVLQRHVDEGSQGHKSPGTYKRHYAPRTKCSISMQVGDEEPGLVFESPTNANQIQMAKDPKEYAHCLYANIADLDSRGLAQFFIQAPPHLPSWTAVWDRLSKATY